jgi:hypothetical protein
MHLKRIKNSFRRFTYLGALDLYFENVDMIEGEKQPEDRERRDVIE